MYKCLAYTAAQATFYDDGVGADTNLLYHLIAGAFGKGLFRKIKDGYTAIAHVYDPNDSIYIFGFSRGAYTARCLAGMIAICGLPTKGFDQNLVDVAFQAYRDKAQRAQLLNSLAAYGLFDAQITCLGVWDTVGELGIPFDPFGIDNKLYGFLDTNLHRDVHNAFQALAIDERRREFPPTLWTPPFPAGRTIDQVWFAGDHSDVGGGYGGLSDITLGWVLNKALGCEPGDPLELIETAESPCPYRSVNAKNALAPIHDEWSPIWGFPKVRSIAQGSIVANSVELRVEHAQTYRPSNLKLNGSTLDGTYGIETVVSPDV